MAVISQTNFVNRNENALISAQFARSERYKQTFGTLVILFIITLIIEGILRKWILTPIQAPLVFLREPVLFIIYYKYISFFGFNKKWVLPYVLFSFFLIPYAVLQSAYYEYNPIVAAFGIRYYIMYIPLAFMMGDSLDERQLGRIVRFLLRVSIPISALVAVQFFSPVDSPINKDISDDSKNIFYVVEGVVRPYGPFSFVAGQNNFAGMMTAILLIAIDQRKKYDLSIILLSVAGFCVLMQGALSGGRTYFGYLFLVFMSYIIAGLTSPKISVGISRMMIAIVFAVSFVFIFVVVFPTSFDAMTSRQAAAQEQEGSTLGRVLDGFLQFLEPLEEAPIFGFGLGAGTNMAAGFLPSGTSMFSFYENEWPRMIAELGPAIGLFILGLRIMLTIWVGMKALLANHRWNQPAGLILFGYSGIVLLNGQVTLQNQLLSFCWISVGLVLAFSKKSKAE